MRHSRLFAIASSAVLALAACAGQASAGIPAASQAGSSDYTADGRLPLAALYAEIDKAVGPWRSETVYAYPGQSGISIRAWRTPHAGPALWLVSGMHGEEPAGPNAIARQIKTVRRLSDAGIPVVLIPVSNPNGYRNNWRYPNTPERDWRKGGGYSVGDSEYLLPNLAEGNTARQAKAPGPETAALTAYALQTAKTYPPLLVLDLHEDELSVDGGYIYSQGAQADGNPVGAEIIRALQSAGITLRMDGKTRFGEPIVQGVISRDDQGMPIRDGSIDELLAAKEVFVTGGRQPGPGAKTVIVVETPADAGIRFEKRVSGHAEVLKRLALLWRLNEAVAD